MEIEDFENNSQRWEWIKYRLRINGCSLSQIDTELGISPGTCLKAKKQNYPKIEKVIADKLGTKPRILWPERYDLSGRPIRNSSRYPRNEDTKNYRCRQCLNTQRVLT